MADEIEIDHIALSVWVRRTQLSLGIAGGGEEVRSQFFRVGFPDSNGCKHPSFVATTWMLWVEAILLELPNIDNGTVAIRQSHQASILPGRGCRHKLQLLTPVPALPAERVLETIGGDGA